HGVQDYKLIPSLYRHPKLTSHKDLLDLESRMIREFLRQGILHENSSQNKWENESIETLSYMQHYGVPTRLLDWTSNPFIALYFSLTDAERNKKGDEYTAAASVLILDPWAWNEAALHEQSYGQRGPALPDSSSIDSYYPRSNYTDIDKAHMGLDPVAILGTANNARMFAQKGMFTIFGKNTDPMEKIFEKEQYPASTLSKVLIEPECIEPLLLTLLSVGYTDSVAYPDHEGLALEIKRLNGFKA